MNKEKKELLTKIAYMYYVLDKTQNDIAKELNIHRTSISRMISKAKQQGIVTISISDLNVQRYELEKYVKEKYSLKQVIIPFFNNKLDEVSKDNIFTQEAGVYLKGIIQNKNIVGVSWGSTLAKSVDNIISKKISDIIFLPIVGGPSNISFNYHVNTIVYQLASKFGGKSVFVNTSVVQESKRSAREIMKSKLFEEITKLWKKLDLAIVGIGGELPVKNNSQWRNILNVLDWEDLYMRKAVGDCCCRFFDKDGKVLVGDLYDRTIGLTLDELKKVPTVVGIARSKQKSRALLAMLKQKYLDILITDEETILEVLRLDGDKKYF